VAPEGIIDYYTTIERTMRGEAATHAFARLFTLPGGGHCGGGEGASTIDYLRYRERRVEEGQAPSQITAARLRQKGTSALRSSFPLDPQRVAFTRLVFPHPPHAGYKGRGYPDDAASFRPNQAFD
jgi:hypothetical protein